MARKKLTAKQREVLDAEIEVRLAEYEAFRTRFEGVVFKARVVWFDRLAGEGYVEGMNGEGRWPLYACNIPGKKAWYPATACTYFEKDAVIDVEVKPSLGCSLLVAHTPGRLDEAKWNSLDHSKLSFRCNESGEAVNGLFG